MAAVKDGIDPPRSNDTTNPRWGTWSQTGTHWVELTWTTAQTIRAVDAYFFDDQGGVRLPSAWRVQSWTGGSFADVPGASGYPVAADRYNRVSFTAVTTTRLRVQLTSNGASSVGLLEVKAHANPPTTPPPSSGWNPPGNLVSPLGQVWTHQEQTYNNLYGFRSSAEPRPGR